MNDMPKHYSLIHEKPDHFMVHDSRDGKAFPIAKKSLHPATQMKVLRLPKFSEGGEEESGNWSDEPGAEYDPQFPKSLKNEPRGQPAEDFKSAFDPNKFGGQAEVQAANLELQQAPVDQEQPENIQAPPQQQPQAQSQVGQPPPAPQKNISYNPMANIDLTGYPTVKGVAGMQGQEMQGIREEAQAKQAQNNALIPIMQQHQAMEEARVNLNNENMMKLQAQHEALMNGVMNQKINPDQYWENHSRVGAAIAALVSGIGAGLQHSTTNLAMQTIENGINKNIEAQKMELGKKENLLSENLRQQGNMRAAEDATRAESLAAFQGKLQLAGAQTGNPILAAQAKQAAAGVGLKYAGLLQTVAEHQTNQQMRQNVMRKLQSGGEPNAVDLVQAGYLPKDLQENAYKEQASIDANKNAHAAVDNLFDRLEKEQTTTNLANPQSHARVKDMGAELTNIVMNSSASKRLTEETARREIDPLITGTFETDKSRQMNRQTVHNLIDNHADPTPIMNNMGFGIKPRTMAPTKTVNGVTYKRGANGEAVRVN